MRTFISYARQDQAAVEALNADLERARVHVWMDEELTGGESWWDTILEQIRSCDLYIFALSPNSLRSRACKAELEYAISAKSPAVAGARPGRCDSARASGDRSHANGGLQEALDGVAVGPDGRHRQSPSSAAAPGSTAYGADNSHVVHERIPSLWKRLT